MPEARDRLIRSTDVSMFFRHRIGGILVDDPEMGSETSSQRVRQGLRGVAVPGGGGLGRGNLPAVGRDNHGRRRANSVLPSWYPRAPLQDITAVVRALERKREEERARLRDIEGLARRSMLKDNVFEEETSGARLEHHGPESEAGSESSLASLYPDTEILTPQKQLLNSLEMVGNVIMTELERLRSSPTAKKEEAEKRVRTLMSMR